jgi:hypothetical protein
MIPGPFGHILEQLVDLHAERVRDLESEHGRRRVLAFLDRDNGLPADPDPFSEGLLSQVEPRPVLFDVIQAFV